MKQFLIVGNINIITYKEVFPYIKTGEVKYRPECCGIKEYVNTDKKAMATWYTTLIPPYIPPLQITKTYNPEDYPKYDNYDAIEVSKTKDIPYDYDGVMGVPITFLDKYCPEQFEILGIQKRNNDPYKIKKYTKDEYANANDLNARGVIIIDGKPKIMYPRILIRHRK